MGALDYEMGLRHADARSAMSRWAGVAAALLAAACGQPDLGPPRFVPSACVVRALTDAHTGWRVSGAEDLALDAEGRVIVSAYDRLTVERALKVGDPPPDGGVYRVAVADLLAGDVTAASAINPAEAGGLRPHGVAVARRAGTTTLAVINRRGRTGAFGSAALGVEPMLEQYRMDAQDPAPAVLLSAAPAPCAANDVALLSDSAPLISVDRERCPGWAWRERLGARRATVVAAAPTNTDAEGVALRTRLAFANGLAVLRDGRVAVAETRAKRVRVFRVGPPSRQSEDTLLPTPGAPDNLTVTPDGMVVAALQPSLLAFALYRYGRHDQAPTRIVARAPATLDDPRAPWTLLYQDESGRQFSGATVAVLVDDVLIAGSARGAGLLVCRDDTGDGDANP